MSNPISSDELLSVVRGLVRVIAGAIIESAALQIAVRNVLSTSFDELFEKHLQTARDTVREQWKPLLNSLDGVSPESLLSMLQGFEGPVQ